MHSAYTAVSVLDRAMEMSVTFYYASHRIFYYVNLHFLGQIIQRRLLLLKMKCMGAVVVHYKKKGNSLPTERFILDERVKSPFILAIKEDPEIFGVWGDCLLIKSSDLCGIETTFQKG